MTTSALEFHVVIPARLASSRLPNKPLADIHGKPMIQWVYENALKSKAKSVTIATDALEIVDVVKRFNGEVSLTRSDHATGTDRIIEVCEKKGWHDETIIVNCQGDEPLMPEQNLTQVASLLHSKNAVMATLHKQISPEQADNPNQVKLISDSNDKALYFSRSKIPYDRDNKHPIYKGHIGLYAYKVGFIKKFSQLTPCELEISEQLEQLRALDAGYDIYTQLAQKTPGPGVDTQEDLDHVIGIMERI